ncbi:hypothetical protein Ddye_016086 [Dipteronia dyeriana]|uniref:DUF8040 domain-containing protein n=1 Tax=Dipteronia dyeriana TaxID=168575 RepID=A0AAD9U6L2_9ROSI|nr:hypothetical protein Ddye_016086 [Dipteronia dyeriana]
MNNSTENQKVRNELMQHISTNEKCLNIIRMSPLEFTRLCELILDTGRLIGNKNAIVEEQVAKFLYVVAHNAKNRTISFFFCRSGENISRHLQEVLRAIITLEHQFLRQPNGVEVPHEIISSHRFYPYFKDCVGAIDGAHIHVKVSKDEAPRYHGRKEYTTQNVMAAYGFDVRCTYVLPRWEGTASDSGIIKNDLARADKLIIPKDAQELFNHRHAALHNAIERTFGVLKKWFPIISRATKPYYPAKTVTKIMLACYILHNYLMGVDPKEKILVEVDQELLTRTPEIEETYSRQRDNDDARKGVAIRNDIAEMMWKDYDANIPKFYIKAFIVFVEMAKKEKINVDGGQPKKDTAKWTKSMDVELLDALLEQQANGNIIDETFTTSAYNNV